MFFSARQPWEVESAELLPHSISPNPIKGALDPWCCNDPHRQAQHRMIARPRTLQELGAKLDRSNEQIPLWPVKPAQFLRYDLALGVCVLDLG